MLRPFSTDLLAGRFTGLAAGDADAPLILLLHGFPEYSGAWEEVAARLAARFRVVAPDQRGYGGSPKPPAVADYAAGKLAGDAAALIGALGGRARAVVGHDWGASVAYALAIKRPDLTARLVVMNGAHPIPFQRALAAGGAQSRASAYFAELRAKGAEAALARDDFARLRALFADGMDMGWLSGARLDRYRAAWSAPGALTGMLNWYRATPLQVAAPGAPIPAAKLIPLDAEALRIRVPHLLIWGMGDTALLPEATEGLEALCDDLTRAEMPGADHWLHHQRPDEVARLIAEFAG